MKIKKEIMVSRFSIIRTILCSNVWLVWNHTRFGFLKTCKPYSGSYNGQFIIFMYAMLLHGQVITFTQSYLTIYDLVFISCFLYGGKLGFSKKQFECIVCVKKSSWYRALNYTCITVKWMSARNAKILKLLATLLSLQLAEKWLRSIKFSAPPVKNTMITLMIY